MAATEEEGARNDYNKYERNKSKQITIEGVDVQGTTRTRRRAIDSALGEVWAAGTLEEVKDALLDATGRLNRTGAFDKVNAMVDEGADGDEKANSARVKLEVEEKSPVALSAGTYIRAGEATMEGKVRQVNGLGWMESASLNFSQGTRSSSSAQLGFSFPLLTSRRGTNIDGEVFRSDASFQKHSSFTERSTGGSIGIAWDSGRLSYLLSCRELADLSSNRTASKGVRDHLGHGLKSALTWTTGDDKRDNVARPMAGHAWQSTTELSGIGSGSGGLISAAKQELEGEWNFPLANSVSLSFGIRLGVLLPLADGGKKATCIADRFFLGGVESFRGFDPRGIGPSDERRSLPGPSENGGEAAPTRDSLGGDLLGVGRAAIVWALPGEAPEALGAHIHAFAQGGSLALLAGPGSKPIREGMLSDFRASCGVGLVVPTPIGRIEANLCRVLRHDPFDRARNGLQVGITTSL